MKLSLCRSIYEYNNDRYEFVKTVEGWHGGNIYIDSRRNATIGYGFNIQGNKVARDLLLLDIFGFSRDGKNGEYLQQLESIIADSSIDAKSRVDQLCDIMSKWYDEPLCISTKGRKRSNFYITDSEAQKIFNVIAPNFENMVDKFFKEKVGLESFGLSKERIALFSLAYSSIQTNGVPNTLGNGLADAIRTDNRAEAWYEIRYRTNPECAEMVMT